MAAIDLCTFNHGLGIYIRILSLASAREKIIELNAQPMVKWAQIYGCHELFLNFNMGKIIFAKLLSLTIAWDKMQQN
jgi:hypothetical protein